MEEIKKSRNQEQQNQRASRFYYNNTKLANVIRDHNPRYPITELKVQALGSGEKVSKIYTTIDVRCAVYQENSTVHIHGFQAPSFFDLLVADAIYTLLAGGAYQITPVAIYRILTGGEGKDISRLWKSEIENSIYRMADMETDIECYDEMKARGKLEDGRVADRTVDKITHTEVHFGGDESRFLPVYTLSPGDDENQRRAALKYMNGQHNLTKDFAKSGFPVQRTPVFYMDGAMPLYDYMDVIGQRNSYTSDLIATQLYEVSENTTDSDSEKRKPKNTFHNLQIRHYILQKLKIQEYIYATRNAKSNKTKGPVWQKEENIDRFYIMYEAGEGKRGRGILDTVGATSPVGGYGTKAKAFAEWEMEYRAGAHSELKVKLDSEATIRKRTKRLKKYIVDLLSVYKSKGWIGGFEEVRGIDGSDAVTGINVIINTKAIDEMGNYR